MKFHFISQIVNHFKLFFVLFYEFYPFIWKQSENIFYKYSIDIYIPLPPEYSITFIYFLCDMFVDLFFSLPFSIYFSFVLEEKFGFNKMKFSTFVMDNVKSIALQIIIGNILISLLIYIISNTGKIFYLYCWIALLLIQFIGVLIYPTLIQPLFNVVTQLPLGELRSKIEEMAQRVNFPLNEIYTIDGSTRSSHSNAYQYGFGKMKRIVIFDTLITQCNDKQILSILCHELGHSLLSHTVKNFIFISIQTFFMFFLFGKTIGNHQIYEEFGFNFNKNQPPPVYIGFFLFQLLYSPIQHILSFIMNIISRQYEYEADGFAVKMGMGKYLREGLLVISKENKSTPIVNNLYSSYHHSHPTMFQRLQNIDQLMKQNTYKEYYNDDNKNNIDDDNDKNKSNNNSTSTTSSSKKSNNKAKHS